MQLNDIFPIVIYCLFIVNGLAGLGFGVDMLWEFHLTRKYIRQKDDFWMRVCERKTKTRAIWTCVFDGISIILAIIGGVCF